MDDIISNSRYSTQKSNVYTQLVPLYYRNFTNISGLYNFNIHISLHFFFTSLLTSIVGTEFCVDIGQKRRFLMYARKITCLISQILHTIDSVHPRRL